MFYRNGGGSLSKGEFVRSPSWEHGRTVSDELPFRRGLSSADQIIYRIRRNPLAK